MSVKDAAERIDHRCRARECTEADMYVLEARCFACGWTGEIAVTVGHEASGTRSTARCPRCECRTISNGNFVAREAAVALPEKTESSA